MSGGVHVEAERWIRPLAVGRGPGLLDALAKDVLRELWGHVRWEIHREPERSERPWVSRAEIAAAIGANEHAVAKQVRKLTQMGWLKWDGRRWALAWAKPWETLQGSPDPVVPEPCSLDDRTLQSEAGDPARSDSEPCTVPKQGTHELTQEPSQVADAPAPSKPVQDPPPQDTATPSADDRADTQPAVTVQITDSSPPAAAQREDPPPPSPAPAKRRRRKSAPPKPGQTALGLADGPPPDDVAELLALHTQLRQAAQRRHGERVTDLPKPASADGRSIAAGVRQALRERGRPWCERMLRFLGERWADDASQLAWSTVTVWRKSSISRIDGFMGQGANGRRSAGLLSAPPTSYDSAVHDYVPPDCGDGMKGF